jgi:hypothetical protein
VPLLQIPIVVSAGIMRSPLWLFRRHDIPGLTLYTVSALYGLFFCELLQRVA